MSASDYFGGTVEPHQNFMPLLWGPIFNVSIFLVRYYYGKLTLLIHILIGFLAVIFTLATSIPIAKTAPIESSAVQYYKTYFSVDLPSHYRIGIACFFLISANVILGILARIFNTCHVKSLYVLRTKRLHKILGYITLILCKSNIYIIGFNKYYGILIQDCVFIIIFILWKIFIPRMGNKINPPINSSEEIRKITTINELSEGDFIIFGNYVYDLAPMKIFHPAGFEVIASVKSKEVDRYIYGMYASEELPEVPKHNHMARCFSLLNEPIARVTIISPFEGLQADQIPVSISSLGLLSQEGGVYQMRLKGVLSKFKFRGYECWEQLGRFYSITLKGKVTRLYTSVNFLVKENQRFMEKVLKIQCKSTQVQVREKTTTQFQLIEQRSTDNTAQRISKTETEDQVPILFKLYKGGRFTQPLINECLTAYPALILSCPKGEGLQFAQLKPGKVILVAGGTGLYPFSDLIDLIFKEELSKQRTELQGDIYKLSPVLKTKSFKDFTFHLLAAFNQLSEIHPITIQQLIFLSITSSRFVLTIKSKQKVSELLKSGKVNLHSGAFDTVLAKELENINEVSKIFICGPPRMNEKLSAFLRDTYKNPDIYAIL